MAGIFFLCPWVGHAALAEPLSPDDALNLYCLRLAYPLVDNIVADAAGKKWLALKNGSKAPYELRAEGLHTGIKESMAVPYPLEPWRPGTGANFAPGRKRPYDFFYILYGSDQKDVRQKLATVKFAGRSFQLNENAARAFAGAAPQLEKLAGDAAMRPLLKPDGGYYWRHIAGENVPSAHSFGIAIDFGAAKAPYWRWSKIMPHPMQKTYPAKIVDIMEKHGFIWGGKWHEYDLMHFEYRPELICKARMLACMRKNPGLQPGLRVR